MRKSLFFLLLTFSMVGCVLPPSEEVEIRKAEVVSSLALKEQVGDTYRQAVEAGLPATETARLQTNLRAVSDHHDEAAAALKGAEASERSGVVDNVADAVETVGPTIAAATGNLWAAPIFGMIAGVLRMFGGGRKEDVA